MSETQQEWRNRIVGEGDEDPEQLLANPSNWRVHPKAQQDALAGVLDDVGWVQRIIVNRQTGHLIDGHLRVSLALRRHEPRIPVEYVDLDAREEALILATLDPLSALAVADREQLDALLREVQTGEAAVQAMLAELAEKSELYADAQDDATYTRNIEAPIYTPKGEKPAVNELFDDSKTRELLAEIDAAELPEDVREFLTIAARRHIVLNYKRIAEYYAHASEAVQTLMENSALVIIDFNRAIELGYVKLSKSIAQQYEVDCGRT